MNPLLWLNAVNEPLCLVFALLFRDHEVLALPLILGALVVPGFTLLEYRYFARRDPQRLQSEPYLLERERLMIQSKSIRDPVDVAAIPVGANPDLGGFEGDATMPGSSGASAAVLPSQESDDDE